MMSHSAQMIVGILITLPVFMVMLFHKHLLSTLLSLELMTMNMVLLTIITISLSSQTITLNILILLTMGATEAVMGLSMLVFMSRSSGSDNPSLLSINI